MLNNHPRLNTHSVIRILCLELSSFFIHCISSGIVVFSIYVGMSYSILQSWERFFFVCFDVLHAFSLVVSCLVIRIHDESAFIANHKFFRILYTFFSILFKAISCIKYGYNILPVISIFLCLFHYIAIYVTSKIDDYINIHFGPNLFSSRISPFNPDQIQNLDQENSPVSVIQNPDRFELQIKIGTFVYSCDLCKDLEMEDAKDCKECICSICLDVMNKKESVKMNCLHSLHKDCFDEYLKTNLQIKDDSLKLTCPVCRKNI